MSQKKITWKKNPAQQKAIDLMQSQAVEILAEGGSRSGKTFIFLYAIFARALKTPNSQHLVCRFHLSELTRTIWQQTVPSVLSICFNNLQVKKNEQNYFIKFPNGSVVQFGGLADKQQTERILGSEYATIFINEASQISYDTYQMVKSRLNSGKTGLLDKLYIDYNPPNKNHWGYKIFHEFLDPVTKQPLSPELRQRYAVVKMNPVDNIANLSPSYLETLKSLSEKQRRRFLYGEYSDDANNALFKRIHIESNRWTAPLPKLIGCCVGVDPAVTSGENSDETGIVVAAKAQIDSKTHFFILADNSVKGTPLEWGKKVIESYHSKLADAIIGETNNGGDMVELTIKNIDKTVNFKKATASRGKAIRAEPVVALYEQGLVHHVGEFLELEDQLCTWSPEDSTWSPDRLDALVWAISYLAGFNGLNERMRFIPGYGLQPY